MNLPTLEATISLLSLLILDSFLMSAPIQRSQSFTKSSTARFYVAKMFQRRIRHIAWLMGILWFRRWAMQLATLWAISFSLTRTLSALELGQKATKKRFAATIFGINQSSIWWSRLSGELQKSSVGVSQLMILNLKMSTDVVWTFMTGKNENWSTRFI